MESRKLKLKVHYRNFTEEELIVNCEALSKERWEIRDGDLLEIFPPEDQETWRSHLILQVKTLPPDIQSKGGPFSLLQDSAVAFNLTSLREVCVRKVERKEVGLDLVELSFKDQYITRSDMWRITCSLLNRCVYSGQYVEHSGMRMQTYCLWYQGEKVTSGAVVSSTRVVFRSASAHVFLFIQISSEMWDFDPSGEFFFDKAVNGFLRELFEKWREAGCNHDVTIAFFWRLYYDSSTHMSVPESLVSIQEDRKRGLHFEDFYSVIVESTSNSDWCCELVNIKKSFLKLKPLIQSLRGKDAEPCKSAEGNILEAINLALNVLERDNVDTNLQLSGQQIIILTAGTGYFETDRALMQLTNDRLIDRGVSTDVVSMRDQPLHAMPLFRFHSKEEEFYSVPQWINYGFYNSPQGRGQGGFQPRIYLSDHLVNTYLQKDKSDERNTQLYNPNSVYQSSMADLKIPAWVDYDKHDATIFDQPGKVGKVQSSGRISTDGDGRGQLTRKHSEGDSPNPPVTFEMGGSPMEIDPFDVQDNFDSTTSSPNPSTIEIKQSEISREEKLTRSLMPARQRYKSENFGDAMVDKLGTSSGTIRDRAAFVSVGSAEALRQVHTPWGSYLNVGNNAKLLQKRRLSFINPFDPNKMHIEASAFQRRWVHVFPVNKRGVAFQVHHASISEGQEEDPSLQSFRSLESSTDTPQHSGSLKRKGVLKRSFDAFSTPKESSLADTPPSGSFRNGSLKSSLKKAAIAGWKQSPAAGSSLGEDKILLRSMRKPRSSPPLNGSSISVEGEKSLPDQDGGGGGGGNAHTPSFPFQTHTPESLRGNRERRNDSFLTSSAEDFASVRRTGMDWTSLVEPAHLPITTDYYPAKSVLDRDYLQYNTSLVIFRDDQAAVTAEGSEEKKGPTWCSDHSSMNTFQAFQEMISQRLSQGFQLAFCPSDRASIQRGGGGGGGGGGQSCREQNSVFLLHEAIERLKSAMTEKSSRRRQTTGSVTVNMGLSRVFQKIVLAFQDISVFIYRLKSQPESVPWPYAYQLSCAGDEAFQLASCQFAITSSEEYNWNFLDQHICGYPDFEELGESLHYWELRYLLLPKQAPLLPPVWPRSDRTQQQEENLISNFVRFLEFLNHIKRSSVGSRKASSIASIPPYHRHQSLPAVTLTPGRQGRSSAPTYETQSSVTSTQSLSPLLTPALSHTPTPRSRQLSEIEEEEERQKDAQDNQKRYRIKVDRKLGERGEKGVLSRSKPESKSLRASDKKRQSASGEGEGIRKVRSRDNLVQLEQGSRSRPESPSQGTHRANIKDSPRTERKKVIRKLKKLYTEGSVASDGSEKSLLQPSVSSSSSSSQREREADLETSLDHYSQTSEDVTVNEGLPRIEEPLQKNSPLEAIQRMMESEVDGLDFLGVQPGLRRGCFIAMDAVKWMVENISGVHTRSEAGKILQLMIDEKMVVHASDNPTVPFLDGYFIYCMPNKEGEEDTPKEMLDSSFYVVNGDFDRFSKKWFEMEIKFPTSGVSSDGSRSPSPTHSLASSLASSFKAGQSYYMGFEHTEETYIPPAMLNRHVELNPDPHFHSSRPEWCYVHYDPVYDPSQAFQLKLQWMVTTTNLLSTQIQSWVHKASMCDFNLVAVPMHKSLLQDHRCTHPFRKPSFVPLSLPAEVEEKWREEQQYGVVDNVRKLLLAIASKNGFLQDCAQVPPDQDILSPHYAGSPDQSLPHFHVHHTGIALVQLVVEVSDGSGGGGGLGETDNHSMWRGSQLMNPANTTSTPLTLSPARPSLGSESSRSSRDGGTGRDGKITGKRGDAVTRQEYRFGFYWHRNFLLPKQKNIPPGLIAKHDTVHKVFVDNCGNRDGVLKELCDQLFT